MAKYPATRSEAKALGLKFYVPGKPCSRGHKWKRSVKHKNCVLCSKERYRAHEEAAEGSHTPEDIARILEAQGGTCATPGCGCRDGLTKDHIVPLSKGGTKWPANIQLLCGACNVAKAAMSWEDFLRFRLPLAA